MTLRGTPVQRERGASPAGSGFRRHPCRCLWRGSAHTTKTTPRRRTILHLSQMRRTLARTFILAIVATVAHAFNGNGGTAGKPSTIETHPPDPQGGGQETGRNDEKPGVRPENHRSSPGCPPPFALRCGLGGVQAGAASPSDGALVRTSGPWLVIAIVCSKWALGWPSTVDCVQ